MDDGFNGCPINVIQHLFNGDIPIEQMEITKRSTQ